MSDNSRINENRLTPKPDLFINLLRASNKYNGYYYVKNLPKHKRIDEKIFFGKLSKIWLDLTSDFCVYNSYQDNDYVNKQDKELFQCSCGNPKVEYLIKLKNNKTGNIINIGGDCVKLFNSDIRKTYNFIKKIISIVKKNEISKYITFTDYNTLQNLFNIFFNSKFSLIEMIYKLFINFTNFKKKEAKIYINNYFYNRYEYLSNFRINWDSAPSWAQNKKFNSKSGTNHLLYLVQNQYVHKMKLKEKESIIEFVELFSNI